MKNNLSRVTLDVHATAAIPMPAWDEIWALTQRFYDTERSYVEGKLKEHGWIALFRAMADRALVGMAALDVHSTTFRGRRLAIIFTSHVLLDERYRGHNLIQRLGLRTSLRARLRYPLHMLYWFFDTFSYRSGCARKPRPWRKSGFASRTWPFMPAPIPGMPTATCWCAYAPWASPTG
jgi:hypothetical protein